MSDKSKELREKLTGFSVSTTDKIMHLMTSKERFYQINKIVMESKTEQEVIEKLDKEIN